MVEESAFDRAIKKAMEDFKPRERDPDKNYMSDDPQDTRYYFEVDDEGHPVGKPYSQNTYVNYKCRCRRCKSENTRMAREYRERLRMKKLSSSEGLKMLERLLDLEEQVNQAADMIVRVERDRDNALAQLEKMAPERFDLDEGDGFWSPLFDVSEAGWELLR